MLRNIYAFIVSVSQPFYLT